jgi:hypothetical protein
MEPCMPSNLTSDHRGHSRTAATPRQGGAPRAGAEPKERKPICQVAIQDSQTICFYSARHLLSGLPGVIAASVPHSRGGPEDGARGPVPIGGVTAAPSRAPPRPARSRGIGEPCGARSGQAACVPRGRRSSIIHGLLSCAGCSRRLLWPDHAELRAGNICLEPQPRPLALGGRRLLPAGHR